MGACICESKNNEKPYSKQHHQKEKQFTKKEAYNSSEIPEPIDDKFKDMPEWEGNILKGYGIKQMVAYKCNLKIDELNTLRDEFWASKTMFRQQWRIVHQACVYDHIKAEEYLFRNNMKTVGGCINECLDQMNHIYKVPNFCINDPYFELELLEKDNKHNNNIKIIVMDLLNNKHTELEVNEAMTGAEIKEQYATKHNIDLNKNVIRLLFGGG